MDEGYRSSPGRGGEEKGRVIVNERCEVALDDGNHEYQQTTGEIER